MSARAPMSTHRLSRGLLHPEEYQLPDHPAPVLVQLGLTYRCNLKCQHCYALYRRDRNEMSADELARLLDELYDAGSCAIVYSHGENLIRRDFHDFANRVRLKGLYHTLMTNGYYIRTVADAERLRDAGIGRVLISVDSSDPHQHDVNRGRDGAYDVAMGAILRLNAAGGMVVGFSTTIDAYNYDRIPQIVELAKDVGVKAISIMQNRYNRPGIFDRAQWVRYEAVCQQIYELMLENRGLIDIYTHDPFMLSFLDERLDDPAARADFIGANICNVAASMISIDPVGNVTGCNFLEEIIGNVRTESVAAIWRKLIARYSDKLQPPEGPCTACSKQASCMGGCKAFHYNAKYDERCGERRFGDVGPHRMTRLSLPIYPTAPLAREAGAFAPRPQKLEN
jgi:radical SAM protein with 4Fe4S-binding SPASM domain